MRYEEDDTVLQKGIFVQWQRPTDIPETHPKEDVPLYVAHCGFILACLRHKGSTSRRYNLVYEFSSTDPVNHPQEVHQLMKVIMHESGLVSPP